MRLLPWAGDVSVPVNIAGSDFSDEVGRDDPVPDQFPRFRGPPPRLRPPPAVPQAAAEPERSPAALPVLQPDPGPASLQPSEIEATKERIKALVSRMERRTLTDALEIGREALRINRVLGHGEFGRWLRDTFGEGRARTIYNWIGMVEYARTRPEEFATFAILHVSAVYLLTAPKAPRDAVEKIVQQIGAGNIPSIRDVRAEIAQAKRRSAEARPTKRQATPGLELPRADDARACDNGRAPGERAGAGDGWAALEAVAQLIPAEDRACAIGLLREAAEALYGLRDLMSILSDASSAAEGSVVARWR